MLRARSEVEMIVCDLPAGMRALYACDGADHAILISRQLSPSERLAALAHELVHLDRGHAGHDPSMPETMRACVQREERRVDRIVAAQLVPLGELQRWVQRRALLEAVTVAMVAEEFDLAEHVAETALELIRRAS